MLSGTLDNQPRRRKRSTFIKPHGHKKHKAHRHHVVDSVRSAARKTRRKFKKKNKHRGKHYYGRYRLNVTEPYQMKFRHHATPRYGFYSPDSLASLLETPKDINKHFERWKVKSGWAALRNGSQNYHSKMHELRRWGLLKQDWIKSNAVVENGRDKAGKLNARLQEKATLLATNNWPSMDRSPKFSFHRVTASSPNLLPRSQKRERSAYVAVSLIPNNVTGRLWILLINERFEKLWILFVCVFELASCSRRGIQHRPQTFAKDKLVFQIWGKGSSCTSYRPSDTFLLSNYLFVKLGQVSWKLLAGF